MKGKGICTISIALSVSVFLFFMFFPRFTFSADSGCIKCHTDEQLLKSLYKPKKIAISEGEG